LVPTRELALQVSSVVKELGKYIKVECMVCTGGASFKEDVYRLENTVHVLVGIRFDFFFSKEFFVYIEYFKN